MIEIIDAITSALSTGANPVTAIRDATGYTLEQLSITSGLATSEIADLEAGADTDAAKLGRLVAALGLPENVIAKT